MESIFKKFIDYVINLFNSANENKDEEEVKQLEYYIPSLDRNESIKFFNEIKLGDIIYAPTSYKEEELKKLSISHQQRPYIVVRKEFNFIIGFCGTSDVKKKFSLPFELDKDSYKVSKDGLIDLGRIVNINCETILSVNDTLSNRDMMKINKTIYTSQLINKTMFDLDLELKPGMLIGTTINSLYFIYKNDNLNVTAYSLQKEPTKMEYIFDGKKYYIDVAKPINLDCNFNYVILSANEIRIVNEIDKLLSENERTIKTANNDEANNVEIDETIIKGPTTPSKKHERFKNNHYFRYDIGQVFVMGPRTFVYLFSSFCEDYAIEIYEDESISPLTRIEHYRDYLQEDGKLEKDEILDVVEETAENNCKCKWLLDLIKQQYGIADNNPEGTVQDDIINENIK